MNTHFLCRFSVLLLTLLVVAACSSSDSSGDENGLTERERETKEVRERAENHDKERDRSEETPRIALDVPATRVERTQSIGGAHYVLIVLADTYATLGGAWSLAEPAETVLEKLRDTFTETLGVAEENVVVLRGSDVTPGAVRATLVNSIARRIEGSGNTLSLYWFGHGATFDRQVHLFPHYAEVDGDRYSGTVSHRELGDWLTQVRHRLRDNDADARILSVIDACRVPVQAYTGKAASLKPVSDVDIFSATDGQFAQVGVFTDAFTSAIEAESREESIWLDRVFNLTQEAVRNATRSEQVPEIVQGNDARFALRSAEGFGLRVTATDATTGQPIERAHVTLNDRTLAAPAVFDGLQPSTYYLQVQAPGYFWRVEQREIAEAEAGATIEVPLAREYVVVEGNLENRHGTQVRVALNTTDRSGVVRGVHNLEDTVTGSGRFELRLPRLPQHATLHVSAADGRLLSEPRLSQAHDRFDELEVTVTDNGRPVGTLDQPISLRRLTLGTLDISAAAEARSVGDVGTGLTVGELTFPEIAFTSRHGETAYREAVRQARAGNLQAADRMLQGVILGRGTDDEGTRKLELFREEVIIQQVVQQYESEPEAARQALHRALRDDDFVTKRREASTQLIRWLGTYATDLKQRGKFAPAVEALDVASTYADQVDEALAGALHAQRRRTMVAHVDAAIGAALENDHWADAERLLRTARDAYPNEPELERLAETLQREAGMSTAARAAMAAADDAFATGDLDAAEAGYLAALADANEHYRTRLAPQLERVHTLQFERHYRTASERQISGDRPGALRYYLRALPYGPAFVEPLLQDFSESDPDLQPVWNEFRERLVTWQAWNEAHQEATVESYSSFVDRYGSSPFAAEALAALERAHAEMERRESKVRDLLERLSDWLPEWVYAAAVSDEAFLGVGVADACLMESRRSKEAAAAAAREQLAASVRAAVRAVLQRYSESVLPANGDLVEQLSHDVSKQVVEDLQLLRQGVDVASELIYDATNGSLVVFVRVKVSFEDVAQATTQELARRIQTVRERVQELGRGAFEEIREVTESVAEEWAHDLLVPRGAKR